MTSFVYVLLCVYSVVGMFVCLVMVVQSCVDQKTGIHAPWVSHYQVLYSVVHLKYMHKRMCVYVGVNVYMCVSSFIRTHLFVRGLYLHVPDAVQEPIAP
jgi:hypothetical protein